MIDKRLVAAVAAVGLLTACGGSTPGSGGGSSAQSQQSSQAPASGGTTVTVKDFKFAPGNLSVAKGTKVTWKFEDSTAHNVTADDKKFASKNLTTGGSYSYTFTTAGKYSYICTIHQYMKGTVTVK